MNILIFNNVGGIKSRIDRIMQIDADLYICLSNLLYERPTNTSSQLLDLTLRDNYKIMKGNNEIRVASEKPDLKQKINSLATRIQIGPYVFLPRLPVKLREERIGIVSDLEEQVLHTGRIPAFFSELDLYNCYSEWVSDNMYYLKDKEGYRAEAFFIGGREEPAVWTRKSKYLASPMAASERLVKKNSFEYDLSNLPSKPIISPGSSAHGFCCLLEKETGKIKFIKI